MMSVAEGELNRRLHEIGCLGVAMVGLCELYNLRRFSDLAQPFGLLLGAAFDLRTGLGLVRRRTALAMLGTPAGGYAGVRHR